jgi:hypothetical protein
VFSVSDAKRWYSQASQAFWQVEDIEKEVTELMAGGVEFENLRHAGCQRERDLNSRRR